MPTKNSPDPEAEAARKVRLMRQINTLFQELSELDPAMAEGTVVDLKQQLNEKSKGVVTDASSSTTLQHKRLRSEREEAAVEVDGRDLARGSDITSFLEPNEINQRSLDNRKLRGPLVDEVALLLLLANDDRSIIFDDIKKEFERLRIDVEDSTLLSRLSRLRSDNRKALEPVSVTGMGLYRLSLGGRKVAQELREKRWPNRSSPKELE